MLGHWPRIAGSKSLKLVSACGDLLDVCPGSAGPHRLEEQPAQEFDSSATIQTK